MTTEKRPVSTIVFVAILMTSIVFNAAAKDIPAILPDPDGKPGDAAKPVKVYILAGQSNMVGMGNLSGAKNVYAGVYLTSDPAAPKGPLSIYRVGNYKIAPLAVYLPNGAPTDKAVAEGLLEVPGKGVYRVHCGFGEGSCNVMELDGKQVYRRQAGGEPVKQDATLEASKRYAFKISGFTGDPPRFWMQRTDLLGYGDLEAAAKREGKFPWLVDDEGEGYAIYVNGKLLAESSVGVGMRQGGQPRGGHIYADFRDEFNGGKVTIAATSFLRYSHPRHGVQPPRGHFTLWVEEQKIPPVKEVAASDP